MTKSEQVDKDARKERQSADAKSSVKAPAKKDGHGGGFTWTGGDNAADNDFVTHDPAAAAAKLNQAPNVSNGEQDADLFKLNQGDFPALGAQSGNAPNSPERKADAKAWERNVAIDKDLDV